MHAAPARRGHRVGRLATGTTGRPPVTVYSIGGPDLTSAAAPRVATLETMCRDLLAMVEQVALGQGVALPERRLIYMAPAVVDCPQVAVMMGGWTPEPQWEGVAVCQPARWVAQLGVAITRVTPAKPGAAGDLPKPSAMTAAAVIASRDAEVLLEVVGGLGEIAGDVTIETPAPEGGLQTVTLAVRVPAFAGGH